MQVSAAKRPAATAIGYWKICNAYSSNLADLTCTFAFLMMSEFTALDELINYANHQLLPEFREKVIKIAEQEICHFPAFQSLEKEKNPEEKKQKAALIHYFLSRNLLFDLLEDKKLTPEPRALIIPHKDEENLFGKPKKNKPPPAPIETLPDLDLWDTKTIINLGKTLDDKTLDVRPRDKSFVVCTPGQVPRDLFEDLEDRLKQSGSLTDAIIESEQRGLAKISVIWDEVFYVLRCTLCYYQSAFLDLEKDSDSFSDLKEENGADELSNLYHEALIEQDLLKLLERIELIEQFFQKNALFGDICTQYFNRVSPLKVSFYDSEATITDFLKEAYEDCMYAYTNQISKEVAKFRENNEKIEKILDDLRKEKGVSEKQRTGQKSDEDLQEEIRSKEGEQIGLNEKNQEFVRGFLEKKVISKANQFINVAAKENSIIPLVVIVNNYAEDSAGRTYLGLLYRKDRRDQHLNWITPSFDNQEIPYLEPLFFAEPTRDLRETTNPIFVPLHLVKYRKSETGDAIKLQKVLRDYFAPYDLEQLCFEMDINYEMLPGDEITTKTVALVRYCQNRNRFDELYMRVKESRPLLEW